MANAKRFPLYDIYQTSWLHFNGIEITLSKEGNRVIFEVPASEETYQLLKEYETNLQIRLLDMVGSLRRMRARMLDLRDGDGRRGRETTHGYDK